MKSFHKIFAFLILFFVFSSNVQAYEIVIGENQKWGTPGFLNPGGTVTYGFSTSAYCAMGCVRSNVVDLSTFMPSGYETEISNAFSAWSAVADIDFELANDPELADIKIAGDLGISNRGLAYAWFPKIGDIMFNANINETKNDGDARSWSLADTGTPYSIFLVALHEIGHSLGLGHSEEEDSILDAYINGSLTGLSADDIAGIQAIYGERLAVNLTDTNPVPLPASVWMMMVGLMSLMPTRKKN